MPDESCQIILLPRQNYWDWVEAAKDYVLRYDAHLTPDPDSAARYMTPRQIITIAGLPNGYPEQGDICAWFRRNYPSIRIDYIPAATVANFRNALQARMEANDRYGEGGTDFKLLWPTDFPIITQPFGTHLELYRRWALPGHEGVDIRAPLNAQVYAGADGRVARVQVYNGNPAVQPYGNCVRLQHRDGYMTTYAHLKQALVQENETVRAGQPIGLAGASGNSAGGYLHLTLKKAGATASGLTNYPRDILDPTPFLIWPDEAAAIIPTVDYGWAPGVCLAGAYGRADGPLAEADYLLVKQARLEAVALSSAAPPTDVDLLREIAPDIFILVRLTASFHGRTVRPDEFVDRLSQPVSQFYRRGVRHFELHNEPNLLVDGWTTSWRDGDEFRSWFLEAQARLKRLFPETQIGYPGLSPGDDIPGQRAGALDFLRASDQAAQTADWLGVHCYWQTEMEMENTDRGRLDVEYRRRYPDKLLFITEFSNPSPLVDKRLKGWQYARYYRRLRHVPGMGAAFAWVLSAARGFEAETWRSESDAVSDIAELVSVREEAETI